MRAPFNTLIILLLFASAFYAGWWMRGLKNAPPPIAAEQPSPSIAPIKPDVQLEQDAQENSRANRQPPPTPVASVIPPPKQAQTDAQAYSQTYARTMAQPEQTFAQLLDQKSFDAAMNLYVEVERRSTADAGELKKLVLSHLTTYLQEGDSSALTGLVDAFLSRYYSDLDVLQLLARHHLQSGYLAEAAHTYQLALNYAIGRPQEPQVQQAFHNFVHEVDQTLTLNSRWHDLISFYETLQLLDLTKPRYLLRQAELYLAHGESVYGRDLLQQLTATPSVSDQAAALLEASSPVQASAESTRHSVTLGMLGSHYHLPVGLNGAKVELIIDTGASTTTVSRQKFDSIRHQGNFIELGPQMFNTANGVAKGTVYRVAEVQLGNVILNDVHIAVLDFDMPPGIDGLLGMNVLSNFRFQVDQDEQRLYLQPRRG